jgi:hypothetical protein
MAGTPNQPTLPIQTAPPHPAVPWTSGARYSPDAQLQQAALDFERRLRLRENATLPLVYLDVGIKGKRVGR